MLLADREPTEQRVRTVHLEPRDTTEALALGCEDERASSIA